MAPPVAVVTGASSGIGLALTEHLLSLSWAVIMADVNPPQKQLDNTKYIRTDISSWDDQAALFKQAYAWHGRLDFCALNAGIDDRDDIFNSLSLDPTVPPRKPNMKTIEVNLTGTYYGIKLASHYLALPSVAAGKPQAGGKIVVTASAASIWPLPSVPQYAASKHALVGLVRSLAPAASATHITVNAVCPALVQTGLAPPGLMDGFDASQVTPMETIIRAFDALAELGGVADEGWVSRGKTGETVVGNLGELTYHRAPPRSPDHSDMDEKDVQNWARAYRDRNLAFAAQDWEGRS